MGLSDVQAELLREMRSGARIEQARLFTLRPDRQRFILTSSGESVKWETATVLMKRGYISVPMEHAGYWIGGEPRPYTITPKGMAALTTYEAHQPAQS